MSATHQRKRNVTWPAMIAALGVTVGVLAGCGGSSSPKATTPTAGQTPSQSNAGGAYAQAGHAPLPAQGSSRVTLGTSNRVHGAVQRGRSTPNEDVSKTLRTQFNPCSLVSVSEAQAITGVAITGRIEAPLGPTCVYKLGGSKADITLAVESLSLSQVTHQMAKPQTLIVGRHRAYCGRLGTQMLFAPLAKGQLLNVTAPCAIAQRFAALALSRLAA